MRVVTSEERMMIQEFFLQFEVDVGMVDGILVVIGKKVFS